MQATDSPTIPFIPRSATLGYYCRGGVKSRPPPHSSAFVGSLFEHVRYAGEEAAEGGGGAACGLAAGVGGLQAQVAAVEGGLGAFGVRLLQGGLGLVVDAVLESRRQICLAQGRAALAEGAARGGIRPGVGQLLLRIPRLAPRILHRRIDHRRCMSLRQLLLRARRLLQRLRLRTLCLPLDHFRGHRSPRRGCSQYRSESHNAPILPPPLPRRNPPQYPTAKTLFLFVRRFPMLFHPPTAPLFAYSIANAVDSFAQGGMKIDGFPPAEILTRFFS